VITAFNPGKGISGGAPYGPPDDIYYPDIGWWGSPKRKPKKKSRCEPAIGPGQGDQGDEKKYREPPTKPPDGGKDPWEIPNNQNRDTGWRYVGSAG
jgi:hypothetical protein